jgi:hypothetical protein
VSNSSFELREFISGVFLTFKVREKTNMISGIFFVSGSFLFFRRFFAFFEAMNRFIIVLKVFIGVLG